MIQAYGYDENAMPNGVGLTRDDLDKDFPDNPVMVSHVSMHGAVLNSAAMKKYGLPPPRKLRPAASSCAKKVRTSRRLVMETAYLPVSQRPAAAERAKKKCSWSRAGQMLYAAAGITTAQEGLTHACRRGADSARRCAGVQTVDIVAYPFILDLDKVLEKNPREHFWQVRESRETRRRENHFGRLAAGQDRLFHHSIPHRRPRRRKKLAR